MTRSIDAAELCRLSTPRDLAVSPEGERVAFTATEWDQGNDERLTALYIVPTDGSAPPHRLSRVAEAGTPRWSPDGSRLGFVGTREEDLARRVGMAGEDEDEGDADEEEEEEPEPQVWAFDLDRGGDAMQLTDREWGVREFDWGPDGERLVISARDPTEAQEAYLERLDDDGPVEVERLQHKFEGVGFTDDVTTYLFVVDLDTGGTTRLDDTAGAGALEPMMGLQPVWHPEDDRVAFTNTEADRPDDTAARDVFVVDVASGDTERLTDAGRTMAAPSWSPGGERLTVSGRDATNWYRPADVFLIDADDRTLRNLSADLGGTVSWFGLPRFVDEDTVVAGIGDAGSTRLFRFTAGGAVDAVDVGFAHERASLRTLDARGGTLAFVRSDPREGDDVFARHGDPARAGSTERLTAMNVGFIEERVQAGFTRTETPNDGVTIESMVYHPETFDPEDPAPHPTIVWTHGGPMSYDDPEFSFPLAYFTSRGYLIVKPNYRGSTSYGLDFAEVLRGRWGTVEVEDVLAVADDLVERGWADADRQFATGFSYGGILTGFLVTRTDRFAAAAAEHGIYDLRAEFGTSDSHVWMGTEFGLPWEDPEAFDASSALLDVGAVETPTLVTAGAEDWRCPPTQSEQFYVSLRKRGVPAKLVVYPGESHDVSAPERAIHRLEQLEAWFATHDPTRTDGDDA